VTEPTEEGVTGKAPGEDTDEGAALDANDANAEVPANVEAADDADAHSTTDRPEVTADEPHPADGPDSTGAHAIDPEATVNLTGDLDATVNLKGAGDEKPAARDDETVASEVTRTHLKGLLEALVFASDKPIKAGELAKTATAPGKQVKELLEELRSEYATRGMQLDEVAGGWIFRTNASYAPFVRDLTKQRPVKLTRAQIETLAILAYRQPITRPELDDVRGVDCGPVLKLLLERDLVRILGKKDEPGRPILYGTTTQFLEFFGLKSLRDLPTLREFTELNEDSRRTVEKELGESLESTAAQVGAMSSAEQEEAATDPSISSDTLPPEMEASLEPGTSTLQTEIPPAMPTSEELEGSDTTSTAAKSEGELDPEEEFPDDDDADFDDEDDEEGDEEEEEEEGDEEEEAGGD
jgi:segregation and condensation protein B